MVQIIPRRYRFLHTLSCIIIIVAAVSTIIFYCQKSWIKGIHKSGTLYSSLKQSKSNHMNNKTGNEMNNIVRKIRVDSKVKTINLESQFINISVDPDTNELFTIISRKREFNFGKIVLNNPHGSRHGKEHYQFLISGRVICRVPPPFLLIIIPSVMEHYSIRQAIRKTWMKAAVTNQWPGLRVDRKVQYLFFLGRSGSFNVTTAGELRQEHTLYQDTVISDIFDSYSNLSRKMLSALRWVKRYCHKAQYVMKADEDTFLNVPLIINLISFIAEKTGMKKFVIGRVHGAQRPEVTRTGRWAVSKRDYPFNVFPPYMYGHSYVFSRASIPDLLSVVDQTNLIPPEDAYLTGILSSLANVTKIDVSSFAICCTDLFDCDVISNRYVSMTAVSTALDHFRLWTSFLKKKCHPQIPFNHKLRYPNVIPITLPITKT